MVTNKAQFDAAVKNTAIKTIKLGDSITGDLTVDRLANLDLNGKTVTGNVAINAPQSSIGTINISAGTITGNLTVDAAGASITNSATVNGTTTINNVAQNTFTNTAIGNLKGEVTIKDADGTRFVNNGTTGIIDVASSGNVTLEGTFDNTIKVTGAATITVPVATVINTPMAIQSNSTIISTVQVPAIIDSGVEVTVKETKEDATGTVVTGTGAEVDIKEEVAKKEVAALTTFLTTAKNYSGYADTPAQGNYKALYELNVQDKTVNIDISGDAEAIAKIQAKPGVEADKAAGLYVMNTFARYVGALNYTDNGALVKEVKYNGTSYTWQAKSDGSYLKGSNWKDAQGTTLVSVVTAANQNGISNLTITLVTKNSNAIDVNFTVTPLGVTE